MGKKRLLSLLMAVVMLFTIVPFSAFAVDRTVTVTVTDKDGDRIEGAEVRIYRTRYGGTETVESGTTAGNGQLTLTYDRRSQYTYYVSASYGGQTETSILNNVSSVLEIELDEIDVSGSGSYPLPAEDVKVYVYVMDDGWEGNSDFESLVGLTVKDANGFYPVGEVMLPETVFTGSSPYLDAGNWNTVLQALKDTLDTSTTSLNRNNSMKDYVDNVDISRFGGIGSGYTALFDWSGSSHGFSDSSVRYHLDLRLNSCKVTYKRADNNATLGTRGYFANTKIKEPSTSEDWYLNLPAGYAVEGYYTNQSCTTPFAFDQEITGDVTIYVKLEAHTFDVTYDLMGGNIDGDTANVVYSDIDYGSATPKPEDPERYGYTFAGWNPEVVNWVTADAVYEAEWTRNEYDITYNWGSPAAAVTAVYTKPAGGTYYEGEYHVVDTTVYEPVAAEHGGKNGYWHFSGWNQNGTLQVEDDITIKGTWTFVETNYAVTFTDGKSTDVLFNDVLIPVNKGDMLDSALDDIPTKAEIDEDVKDKTEFTGWLLKSVQNAASNPAWTEGTLYQRSELTGKEIHGDLVFEAQYAAIPEYRGIVKLILNGSYDSGTHTATGTQISVTDALGADGALYVRLADNSGDYIELTEQADGSYSEILPNGTYNLYYSADNGASKIIDHVSDGSAQQLIITNQDRTRYLFFNSVEYILAGGQLSGGESLQPQNYVYDTAVEVTDIVPTRADHDFLGWELNTNGLVYHAGDTLPDIHEPYTLTALWEKHIEAQVDLTINVDHVHRVSGTKYGVDNTPGVNNPLIVKLTYKDHENKYVETLDPAVEKANWFSEGTRTGAADSDVYKTATTYSGIFSGLSAANAYSLNVFLDHYTVEDSTVTVTTDIEGNVTYHVTVDLQYNPDLFTLTYKVVADSSVPDELVPKAVDIKVGTFLYPKWQPISRHNATTVDVNLDENGDREGTGSYNVPVKNSDDTRAHYRVDLYGLTLDVGGRIIEPTFRSDDGVHYSMDAYSDAYVNFAAGAYTATVEVKNGTRPTGSSLDGVYGTESEPHTQVGEIIVTVYVHRYDVILDENHPSAGAKTVIEDLFRVPDLSAYRPTRANHTFGGWYKDPGCNDGNEYVAGAVLSSDTTLYAKWKPDRKIEGTVAVAGSYEQAAAGGGTTTQIIYDIGRAKSATVALQRIVGNGYAETGASATVHFGAYDPTTHIAVGTYELTVPDDGNEYRILVRATNYNAVYQNEPDSLDSTLKNAYTTAYGNTKDDFSAVYGETDPAVATINAYLKFVPESFDLHYEIDSTEIGAGYRPDHVEALISYNSNDAALGNWPIISQMVFGPSLYIGQDTALTNGLGANSYPVWRSYDDGTKLYQYAAHLYGYTINGVETQYNASTAPFAVGYERPAYYVSSANPQQNKMLKIILTPKKFDITYDMNTDDLADVVVPNGHTWSKPTAITLQPERPGYEFLGWYDSTAEDAGKVTGIPASTAQHTTLYAKWRAVQDKVNVRVVLDHRTSTGEIAANYDKDLEIQLTYSSTENGIFADYTGEKLTIPGTVWHTVGAESDTYDPVGYEFEGLSSAYFYDALVHLDEYYVTDRLVTRTDDTEGNTTHNVVITLKFQPKTFQLQFHAEMDGSVDPDHWPESAEVKVSAWSAVTVGGERVWKPIQQHASATVTVSLDDTGKGTASYPVWVWDDEDAGKPYYYRIEVVSLKMKDGVTRIGGANIGLTEQSGDVIYRDEEYGIYTASVDVTGGAKPDGAPEGTPHGAYSTSAGTGFVQNGVIRAVISASDIDVILDPNGGILDGSVSAKTLADNIVMPDLSGYQPTRTGYTFGGWYLSKTDFTKVPALPNSLLKVKEGNVTVYAKWDPITYPITYVVNGGMMPTSPAPKTTYTIADTDYTLPTPTRENYVFDGWYENSALTGVAVTKLPAGSMGHKYYYAKWEKDVWHDTNDTLNESDGIPDKYQAVVVYEAASGGELTGGATSKTEVYTLLSGTTPVMNGTLTAAGTTAVPHPKFAFDSWSNAYGAVFAFPNATSANPNDKAATGSITFAAEGNKTYTFTASFAADLNDDSIPDQYQYKVTFKIENGTWDGTDTALKTVYVTRYAADGVTWSKTGTGLLTDAQIPAGMQPDTGHTGGQWTPETPTASLVIDRDRTFTYSYAQKYDTVRYHDESQFPLKSGVTFGTSDISVIDGKYIQIDPNGGLWQSSTEKTDLQVNADLVALAVPTRENYVFVGWKRTSGGTPAETGAAYDIQYTFTAQWEKDVWSDSADSLNTSDDIPDKYQSALQYTAGTNGRIVVGGGKAAQKIEVYTLTDDGGYWITTDSFTSSGADAAPNSGYALDKWSTAHTNVTFMASGVSTGAVTVSDAQGGVTYVVAASFARDNWKENGDNDSDVGGDGKPDYQQAIFYFNASANGSITDTNLKIQVFDLEDPDADGVYSGSVTPETVGVAPDSGYMLGRWSHAIEPNTPAEPFIAHDVTGGYSRTYTAYFEKDVNGDDTPDKHQAFVNFAAKENGAVTASQQVFTFADHALTGDVKPDKNLVTVTPDAGYAFDLWTKDDGTTAVDPWAVIEDVPGGTTITFYAHFAEDVVGSDDVPDKYERKITFQVENGTWKDGTIADKIEYVTLFDAHGNWSENGIGKLKGTQIPGGMIAYTGHEKTGEWLPYAPTYQTEIKKDMTFKYVFELDPDNVTYEDATKYPKNGDPIGTTTATVNDSEYIQVDPNGGTWRGSTDKRDLQIVEEHNALEAPTREDYVFVGWLRTLGGTPLAGGHSIVYTFTAQWEKDVWKDDPAGDSLTGGDEIPDKYQVAVQYRADVNGAIKAGENTLEVFTLENTDGVWIEQTAELKAVGSAAQPDSGYAFDAWSNGYANVSFAADQAATGAVTITNAKGCELYGFTASFGRDTGGDGIPDMYQIKFIYETADALTGTVNKSSEVIDLRDSNGDLVLTGRKAAALASAKTGYAFDYWTLSSTRNSTPVKLNKMPAALDHVFASVEANTAYTFTAYFAADNSGTGVPDKYEVEVTFTIENGTWSDDTTAPKKAYVTLYDEHGNWSETGHGHLTPGDIPTGMKPASGYLNGEWRGNDPMYETEITELVTYPFEFAEQFWHITYPSYEKGLDAGNKLQDDVASIVHERYIRFNPNGAVWNFGGEIHSDANPMLLQITSDVASVTDPTRPDYVFMGWSIREGTAADTVGTVQPAWVFTAQWAPDVWSDAEEKLDLSDGIPDMFQIAVQYGADANGKIKDGALSAEVITMTNPTGKWISRQDRVQPVGSEAAAAAANCVFDRWSNDYDNVSFARHNAATGILNIIDAKGTDAPYQFTALFAPDNNGDGIPDKYQKKVTFKVEKGAWDDGSKKDITVYVELKSGGIWSETGSGELTVPAVGSKPDDGFKAGGWDMVPPAAISGTAEITYTYTYARSLTPIVPTGGVKYIVEHYKANADGTYPNAPTERETLSDQIGVTVTAIPKTYAGYCVNTQVSTMTGTLVKLTAPSDIVVLKLYYDTDIVGGDGIPDKYQAVILYKPDNAKMGTVDPASEIITIKDGGSYAEQGTVTIKGSAADPKSGYGMRYWTDTGDNEVTTERTLAAQTIAVEGGKTYVYTAHFYKKTSGGGTPTVPEEEEIVPDVGVPDGLNGEEHFQYIMGDSNGTVRPLAKITRAEVAAIFYRLLKDEVREQYFTTESVFPDLHSGLWYNKAAATLANAGIFTGCDDGKFHGERTITRAELATVIAKFDDHAYAGEDLFHDISKHWGRAYINACAANGWIVGDGSGKFRPYDAITRAEVMTMINAVLQRSVDADGLCEGYKQWPDNTPGAWYYYQVIEATNYHEYVRAGDRTEDWVEILPDKVWNESADN